LVSASPDLIRGVSETLAGRILFIKVPGFTIGEIEIRQLSRLWVRGGFPRSFLAVTDSSSFRWRESFVTTFLERDIPQLGIRIPSETLRRYLIMTAHYHGQVWNGSEIARAMSITHKTARHYLDLFSGAYIIRILAPWFENLKKRQVKSPKIFIRDSGLLHFLLDIEDMRGLRSNPRYGASWEGFAMEQILAVTGDRNIFFWKTQHGAELDLLMIRKNRRIGFEFKCSDAPGITRSMKIAVYDLKLDQLFVVYPGSKSYFLDKNIQVIPVNGLPNTLL